MSFYDGITNEIWGQCRGKVNGEIIISDLRWQPFEDYFVVFNRKIIISDLRLQVLEDDFVVFDREIIIFSDFRLQPQGFSLHFSLREWY